MCMRFAIRQILTAGLLMRHTFTPPSAPLAAGRVCAILLIQHQTSYVQNALVSRHAPRRGKCIRDGLSAVKNCRVQDSNPRMLLHTKA